MRGFFGIAVYHPKKHVNIGTLSRSAKIFGASFFSVIGPRFSPQNSDVIKSYLHMPVFDYKDFDDFYTHLPFNCQLVGVELSEKAKEINQYNHPQRACYLLGAEDHGLPDHVMDKCVDLIKLKGNMSLNVAVAGSIVMHHRLEKRNVIIPFPN